MNSLSLGGNNNNNACVSHIDFGIVSDTRQ